MTARIFVDTNILVYAYDLSEKAKQAKAFHTIDLLARTGAGIISSQMMAEFFVAVTRRIKSPLTHEQAYARLQNYQQSWQVMPLTATIVMEAARGVQQYQFSYWDAQIWATARLNQVNYVFSEDFNTGAVIEGVRFVNPLADEFVVEDWI